MLWLVHLAPGEVLNTARAKAKAKAPLHPVPQVAALARWMYLRGKNLVDPGELKTVARSVPHAPVAIAPSLMTGLMFEIAPDYRRLPYKLVSPDEILSSMSLVKHLVTRLKSAKQCLIEITQELHAHLHSLRHDVVHLRFWMVGPMYCFWHSSSTGSKLLATRPCFDDLYSFRKLMLSGGSLNSE